jgi:AraC-like DNA-binding protein/ligand-binding sensor protein
MASAPGIDFLPIDEKQLFAREFEKDSDFLYLLILMISKSCATGSVDITWMNDGNRLRQVIGTTQAANSACSRYLQWGRQDPSQRFCNIVSDYGRRAADSCAVCENAAERRVGVSGRAQVYRCHAGLTDIAVPVISEGRHIATLYSGQVLTAPPSKAGFAHVAKEVSALSYIDLKELETAYREVPVVSEEDIAKTVKILEMLADFLARFWTRLGDTVRAARQKMRATQLAAKEFAYMVLQPEVQDRARLSQLMRELGFIQPPNRVLVVKFPAEEEFERRSASFDLEFTTALQVIEEMAEKNKNMAVAYLRRRGVSVFFRDVQEGPSAGLRARPLAEKILYQVSDGRNILARVGIGGLKQSWGELAESYHEACMALAGSENAIAACGDSAPALSELTMQTELACQQLADQRIREARMTLRGLPMLANRRLGSAAVADHRKILSSALESLCFTALKAGCDSATIGAHRCEMQKALVAAGSVFDIQEVFLEAAETITDEVRRLLNGKRDKVITRVRQMIDLRLKEGRNENALSLSEAAKAVGVSTGHLSRLFRRVAGMTFRDYATSRRIEYARRLLLDPLNNISAVSERCGFSTPAYFARVFRKVVGCAPTEYASNPRRAAEAGPAVSNVK